MKKNIIFGASGLIGKSFYNLLNKKNNFFFFSKSDQKFKTFDLNKNLKKFPIKEVDICFFCASPRINQHNLRKNLFNQEYTWLENVISNIKINKLIYLSSSSVYYHSNHKIGKIKKKCENYIIKNKNKFLNYQIWRPFNLVGKSYVNSDHFHNYLFKQMFVKKKKNLIFLAI